jgi:predicted ribosomally synthesized peptide with nif11-like leader
METIMSMKCLGSFIQRMENDTAFRTKMLESNSGKRIEILKKEGFHFTTSEYSAWQGQILGGAFREDETKQPGSDMDRVVKDSWLSQSFHSEEESVTDIGDKQ